MTFDELITEMRKLAGPNRLWSVQYNERLAENGHYWCIYIQGVGYTSYYTHKTLEAAFTEMRQMSRIWLDAPGIPNSKCDEAIRRST